jgi:hypothetical protein
MMCSGRSARVVELALAGLALSVLLLTSPTTVPAQGQYTRIDGRVQWIAGEKMMLIPVSGALPVSVDLTQIPQEQYAALAPGTLVVVDGVVSPEGRRVLARSITTQSVREEQLTMRPPSRL